MSGGRLPMLLGVHTGQIWCERCQQEVEQSPWLTRVVVPDEAEPTLRCCVCQFTQTLAGAAGAVPPEHPA